jgi:hypothetical protein
MCPEGQQLRYCGVGAQFEDVIIKGNPGEMKVSFQLLSIRIVRYLPDSRVHRILRQGQRYRCSRQVRPSNSFTQARSDL